MDGEFANNLAYLITRERGLEAIKSNFDIDKGYQFKEGDDIQEALLLIWMHGYFEGRGHQPISDGVGAA